MESQFVHNAQVSASIIQAIFSQITLKEVSPILDNYIYTNDNVRHNLLLICKFKKSDSCNMILEK